MKEAAFHGVITSHDLSYNPHAISREVTSLYFLSLFSILPNITGVNMSKNTRLLFTLFHCLELPATD